MRGRRHQSGSQTASRVFPGLVFERVFTREGQDPLSAVPWVRRDLPLRTTFGETVLTQKDVEVPAEWSQEAAVEWLRNAGELAPGGGAASTPLSLREAMRRGSQQLVQESVRTGYFRADADARVFAEELMALQLAQCLALPGLLTRWPLHGAADIDPASGGEAGRPRRWLSLEDPELAVLLAGRTREDRAQAAPLLGLPEELLRAAEQVPVGPMGPTVTPELQRSGARELLDCIAESIWKTDEPALAFSTTLRRWHGTRLTDPVERATQRSPVRATLNLLCFVTTAGELDLPVLRHAVALAVTALDLALTLALEHGVDGAAWLRTHRPLALGLANVAALLMESGLAYDTPLARSLAAAITAVAGGEALVQSARLAETCPPPPQAPGERLPRELLPERLRGACAAVQRNREPFLEVVRQARAAAYEIPLQAEAPDHAGVVPIRGDVSPGSGSATSGALAWQLPALAMAARERWEEALALGETTGFRNAELTTLEAGRRADTLLETDTPGLLPMSGLLARDRRSVAGARNGRAKPAVRSALFRMGYSVAEASGIIASLEANSDPQQAPFLRVMDRAVFARAESDDETGAGWISPAAVVRMMAAAQPFVSTGAPVELEVPERTDPDAIAALVLLAWRGGLRALAIHRRRSDTAQRDVQFHLDRLLLPLEDGAAVDPHPDLPGETAMTALRDTLKDVHATERSGLGEVPPPSGVPAVTSWPAPANREATPAATEPTTAGGAPLGGSPPLLSVPALGAVPPMVPVAPTLAEAERQLLEREQAALLESQLHHISELKQQVNVLQSAARENADAFDAQEPPRAVRHRLPSERASMTHKFSVAGHEGYITVGLYPNGSPGEIFIRMSKESSAVSGLLDSFSTGISLALQHGVPLRVLADHFRETRFEPAGETGNEQIPYARSLMDYLFRWMELRFLSGQQMDLFAGLSRPPAQTIPVTGSVSGPRGRVTPHLGEARTPEKP